MAGAGLADLGDRSEQVFVGKPQAAHIQIVEFDRPSRFAFAITQRKQGSTKDVRYRHSFVLTPAAARSSSARRPAWAAISSSTSS